MMGRTTAPRHILTDEQWEAVKDLLAGKDGDRDRTGVNNRASLGDALDLLNGLLVIRRA